MDYHALKHLRLKHPGWRLLAADNGPFIIAFLYQTYLQPNVRVLNESTLLMQLDDFLHHLRETLDEARFSRSAVDYLQDWVSDGNAWLRRFYPDDSDEPHYDLTSATEKAIQWLARLDQGGFVGAESRLRTIFDLLQQMIEGTETDPQVRIAKLERQRDAIEEEIEQVRTGRFSLLDATQLRERYHQVEQTAGDLLADFRQVEQNFRDLDRGVRERITLWEGGKGEMLEAVFSERDGITDSDQGRSFHAFWDFLMSPSRQEELSHLLERMMDLEAIAAMHPDPRLKRVHYDWLEAGENTQHTVAGLSEQLRKYLDDQAWLENRRIMQLIHGVERRAVAVRERMPDGVFMGVDDLGPAVQMSMERPLYSPPFKPSIDQQRIEPGDEAVGADSLFEQVYVDKAELGRRVQKALQSRGQVALSVILEVDPLEQGLAELVAYLSLAAEGHRNVIDDTRTERVSWVDADGTARRAELPTVIFCR